MGSNVPVRNYVIAKVAFITAKIIASLDFIPAVHVCPISYIISSLAFLYGFGLFQFCCSRPLTSKGTLRYGNKSIGKFKLKSAIHVFVYANEAMT